MYGCHQRLYIWEMNKTIHFAPLFVIDMTPQSHWRFMCSLISWDTTVKWWETSPPHGSHHWVNGVNFACIGEKKQKFWWLQPQKCSHIWDRRSDIYSLLITKWSKTSNLLDNWQACWFNPGTGCWFAEIVPVWMIHRNSYFAGKNLQVWN